MKGTSCGTRRILKKENYKATTVEVCTIWIYSVSAALHGKVDERRSRLKKVQGSSFCKGSSGSAACSIAQPVGNSGTAASAVYSAWRSHREMLACLCLQGFWFASHEFRCFSSCWFTMTHMRMAFPTYFSGTCGAHADELPPWHETATRWRCSLYTAASQRHIQT